MPTLLHLDSSANGTEASVTRRLGAAFAAAWTRRHGDAVLRYRDLAAEPVPPLATGYCELGRRVEQLPPVELDAVGSLAATDEERAEWDRSRPLIEEVLGADVVLVGAPMYNYGIPALLKAWIDRITFPGAFRDPATGADRLAGAQVVVVAASGGAYGEASPRRSWDHQVPYLRTYFASIGIRPDDVHVVRAELTLAHLVEHLATLRPEADASRAASEAAVVALAGRLGTRPVPVTRR